MARHLLATTHDYVLLGTFTSDHIEKEFGKLRQGSGGAYLITVRQIVEKVRIMQALLALSLQQGTDMKFESVHKCTACNYAMNEQQLETFTDLESLEEFVLKPNLMALLYIAGYVTRNDPAEEDSATYFYYEKYGSYLDEMTRGGLKVPTDSAVQWTIFCFIMLQVVKSHVCRTSLSNILFTISEIYCFGMEESHAQILANIFIKNECLAQTPRSDKEPALKVLKLSYGAEE